MAAERLDPKYQLLGGCLEGNKLSLNPEAETASLWTVQFTLGKSKKQNNPLDIIVIVQGVGIITR